MRHGMLCQLKKQQQKLVINHSFHGLSPKTVGVTPSPDLSRTPQSPLPTFVGKTVGWGGSTTGTGSGTSFATTGGCGGVGFGTGVAAWGECGATWEWMAPGIPGGEPLHVHDSFQSVYR